MRRAAEQTTAQGVCEIDEPEARALPEGNAQEQRACDGYESMALQDGPSSLLACRHRAGTSAAMAVLGGIEMRFACIPEIVR